ncbi:hypothetical protein RJ639_040738 [Escallonia herrerae]|uniref:Uncharacterized protein n=1 Tax=Escallonia herrerae TaxID=1293975 RepID=A0AA89B6W7_9ASTE|nr:hypothetical protein RJ639_040738 [Escallonia herrerae]
MKSEDSRSVWSLIAGRLPGRTANDVKNYWNTHLLKKLAVTPNHQVAKDANQTAMKTTIIRPRPRTFSKNPSWLKGTHTNVMSHNNIVPSLENRNKASPTVTDDSMHWWDDLVVDEELGQGVPFSLGGSEEPRTTELWTHELLSIGTKGDERFVQKGDGGFSDYSMNMDIWDLLSSDQLLA